MQTIEEVRTACDRISVEAAGVLEEINRLLHEIAAADDQKKTAKDAYQTALDAGDERGMKSALSRIREANATREGAVGRLTAGTFSGRIESLDKAHNDLCANLRQLHEATLQAVRTAEAARITEEQVRGKISGLLHSINGVRDQWTEARDIVAGPRIPEPREDSPVEKSIVYG